MRVVACAVVVIASIVLPSSWIESCYSRGVYPWIQAVLVPAFGWTSIPIMGSVIVVLPIAIVILATRNWRRARRNAIARGAIVLGGVFKTVRALLYVYTMFLMLWGFGYRREPIESRWQLGFELPTYEQVHEVQLRILALLHRDCVPEDERDETRAMQSILDAELKMIAELEGWKPKPTLPKHPPAGTLMAIGIFGIVSPFTLEANVEGALPPPFRLGISGHELAHIFGYCGEADANVVSFVAGLRAEDPFARYATALTMLRYTGSPKHLEDSMWVFLHLPKQAKDDLAALRSASADHRIPALADLSHAMNDRYLKTQGVKLGVDDYSRGYTLFVRAWARGLVELPPPYASGK